MVAVLVKMPAAVSSAAEYSNQAERSAAYQERFEVASEAIRYSWIWRTGTEKDAILRRHLIDKVAVSDLCDQHQLQPTIFYAWQSDRPRKHNHYLIRDAAKEAVDRARAGDVSSGSSSLFTIPSVRA